MTVSNCFLQLRDFKEQRFLVTNVAEKVIPVGMRITQVFKHNVTVKHPLVHRVDMGQVASVQVVTDQISLRMGDAPVPEIPIGWSAAIRLSGDGIDTLMKMLQNAEKDEQFLLR